MARMHSGRLTGATLAILLMLVAGSCKRENGDGAGALTGSLIFDNASPDMREALASRVDFRINDDNFGRWEEAQRNLERLPRSAIPTGSATGRSAIDRAVARLESSPYSRTAIERAGLSVREFVLATIALAQATEVAQTGKTLSRAPIPAENFQFVQRYAARALYSRSRAARREQSYDWNLDEADGNNNQVEMDMQMRLEEAERQAEMQLAEQEMQREEVERAAELQREEAERAAEQQREEQERAAESQREETERAAEMQREAVEQQAERLRAQRERDSTRRRRQ